VDNGLINLEARPRASTRGSPGWLHTSRRPTLSPPGGLARSCAAGPMMSWRTRRPIKGGIGNGLPHRLRHLWSVSRGRRLRARKAHDGSGGDLPQTISGRKQISGNGQGTHSLIW